MAKGVALYKVGDKVKTDSLNLFNHEIVDVKYGLDTIKNRKDWIYTFKNPFGNTYERAQKALPKQ